MSILKEREHGCFFLNPSSSRTRQSNLPTFLSLLFLSLLTQCHVTQGYSRITFCYNKENYEGQRLNTTVHQYLNATSEFDCGANCYHNSCCRSANFRKIHGNDGQGNCELLHALEWEVPGKLQKNATYDYLIMLQPQRSFDCTCLSCNNGGTCNENTKKCSCHLGFGGNRCEKGNLKSSLTLRSLPNHIKQLNEWLPSESSWHICYRASENGWLSSTFHSRCDFKGPTVTIIRVDSYIFGGYTDKSWGGSLGFIHSSKSFLFSLKNNDNLEPFKAPVYRNWGLAIYTNNGYGPTFGGHDIFIANNANTTGSHSNFGNTYQPPPGYFPGHGRTNALLAGSQIFKPSEIEIYYLR